MSKMEYNNENQETIGEKVARIDAEISSQKNYLQDVDNRVIAYHERLREVETMKIDVVATRNDIVELKSAVKSLLEIMQGPTGEPQKGWFSRVIVLEKWMFECYDKIKGSAKAKFDLRYVIIGGIVVGLSTGIAMILIEHFFKKATHG